jgi:vacuolar-type H+-ATPase subunit D/Vma8
VEEDEQKVKLEKERYMMLDTKNSKIAKEFQALEDEVKQLRKENQAMFRETHD